MNISERSHTSLSVTPGRPVTKKNPQIILEPFQAAHNDLLTESLNRFPVFIDKSLPGSGKTFTTTNYAINNKFKHVIVVCPNSMLYKWEGMKIYGSPIRQVINFESLRSVRGKTPKHGLLTRLDIKKGKKNMTFFYPTDEYLRMVSEGLLLVIDEIQNIKNATHQNKACKCLCDSITSTFHNSKIMLLSGAPGDKIEHYCNILQIAGIIKNPKLCVYHKSERVLEYVGFQDLLNFF